MLRGKGENIDSLASSYMFAGTVLYSRDSVETILSNWPSETSLSADSFGDENALFTFIKSVYLSEESRGIENSTILATLRSSIQAIIRSKRRQTDFCSTIIGFSTHQISENLKFLTTLKKTKAIVKTIESKHPYADNLDEVTELSIPGAKYLKIVFDRRSATESGCDYVQICRDESRTSFWNDTPYSGRRDSQNWAGVTGSNGRVIPACIVNADKCFVYFHSDGNTNDWGYKLTCYGIIEEADEEEKEIERDLMASFTSMANLACWLFEIVCREKNPATTKKLLRAKTIRVLRRYVDIVSWNKKEKAINLIIDIGNQLQKVICLPRFWFEINFVCTGFAQ